MRYVERGRWGMIRRDARLIARAASVAQVAHHGQLYGGADYFAAHVCAVVGALPPSVDPETVAAAYLHDVLEDTAFKPVDLLALDIPAEVVLVVMTLTRRDGETYQEYIGRVMTNSRARAVKRADLTVNMRNPKPTLAGRYQKALDTLDGIRQDSTTDGAHRAEED